MMLGARVRFLGVASRSPSHTTTQHELSRRLGRLNSCGRLRTFYEKLHVANHTQAVLYALRRAGLGREHVKLTACRKGNSRTR